ncbi:MAG: CopG family transcriptional regulator, partial [Rhodanobacter sp.]
MPPENRTARLTVLIDPRKKAVFERLCAGDDTTPSQVVRQLIRDYIEQKSGHSWQSEYDLAEKTSTAAKSPRT